MQTVTSANTLNGLIAVAQSLNLFVIPGDYDFTSASGVRRLTAGDRVRVGASATAGGDVGSVYEYRGFAGDVDLATTTYDVDALWKKIVADEDNPTEGDLNSLFDGVSNLNVTSSDARAVGILVVLNDLRSSVDARVAHAAVSAASVTVAADERAQLVARGEVNVAAFGGSFFGTGTLLSVAAQIVTNLVLSSADASLTDSTVAAAGAVVVQARNASGVDARLRSSAQTGDTAYGFLVAFNSVGWKPQNVLFNAIDALLGDPLLSEAFDGEQPARAVALVDDATIAAGALTVEAVDAAKINATVSNAAESVASALYGAVGKVGGFILASNKVSSSAQATLEDSTVDVTGALRVAASDDAGIFANVKFLASSVTTNDGGVAVLQGTYNNFVDADFLTSEGERTIDFGKRVRISKSYGDADHDSTEDDADLVTGEAVRLADDYATTRLASDSGKRLLGTGDNVTFADGYGTGGDDGVVYRYLGDSGRVDLAAEDYSDGARWQRTGGVAGGLYRYLGSDATGVDLSIEDYADTSRWALAAGAPGTVYTYMGTTQTLDLSAQDYGDLGYWRPVAATSLLPTGINISDSPSSAFGGIVVLNDARSDVQATILRAKIVAGSVTVSAIESAVIRATADSSAVSSGGSTITGVGTSLAVNGIIATNVVLSRAVALVEDSDVRTLLGGVEVEAANLSQIDAVTLNATTSANETVGFTLAFNSIGWNAQNFLFNAVDAILGDPLVANAFGGENTALTRAAIVSSRLRSAAGVGVTADDEAVISAEVSNVATAAALAFTGATSLAIGVVIASNMISSSASAAIDFATLPYDYTPAALPALLSTGDRVRLATGEVFELVGAARGPPPSPTNPASYAGSDWVQVNSVTAAGPVVVTATAAASIDARSTLEAISSSRSDGGLGVVTSLLDSAGNDYEFTTRSGVQELTRGDLVRVHEGYANPGEDGRVYAYTGTAGSRNLATQNYATGTWRLDRSAARQRPRLHHGPRADRLRDERHRVRRDRRRRGRHAQRRPRRRLGARHRRHPRRRRQRHRRPRSQRRSSVRRSTRRSPPRAAASSPAAARTRSTPRSRRTSSSAARTRASSTAA